MKSHWTEGDNRCLAIWKEEGKRKPLALSRNMWIGTEVTIEADGTVFINGKDRYTPEEVVVQRKRKSIPEL